MPGTNKEDPAARSSARLTADTFLRVLVRRLVSIAAILLVIAYVTLFGLILAERGRAGLPAEPLDAGAEALRRTLDYLINHPITYYWQHEDLLAKLREVID